MIVTYLQLQKYLPQVSAYTPQEIGDILTSIGLEVAGIETIEAVKGGLKGVVLGKVLTCVAHPNSDHLHITTVDVGASEPLPIVCGAPNVAAGQTVLVATPGTVLYHDGEPFTIKKSKLRGEPSHGMICSQKELGLGEDQSGIWVLTEEGLVPGTPAAKHFALTTDYAIEIEITPNRVDATSFYGVARDLAAYLSFHTGQMVQAQLPPIEAPQATSNQDAIVVSVEVPATDCPRYQGLTIRGIANTSSPEWLQKALTDIGLHPINAVVDITNFVLMELGQPLHAFDADKIAGKQLRIAYVPNGTPFETLEGIERKLVGTEIMICDQDHTPLCMGGVMGGKESGVTDTTTDLFLESANFNPSKVRKAARKHGISTDSSFRFERGLSAQDTTRALYRAAALITEICGGQVVGQPVDIYPEAEQPHRLSLTYSEIDKTIGHHIKPEEVRTILQALEIEIVEKNAQTLHLSVPAYRVDITRPADVIEDILRIYGYNRVPLTGYIHANLSTRSPQDVTHKNKVVLSEQLVGAGFREILNNSLTGKHYFANNEQFPENTLVELENPLSGDLNILRPTLLIGCLESIALNLHHKQPYCAFFEWGTTYTRDPKKQTTPEAPLAPFTETPCLALALAGTLFANAWNTPEEPASAFRLKGVVEKLLIRSGLNPDNLFVEMGADSLLAQKLTYRRFPKGPIIAELGAVSPQLLQKTEVSTPVYFANLYTAELFAPELQKDIQSVEWSKFPVVKRDLAYLIDKGITFQELRNTAMKAEKKLLKKVELFDLYEGKNLPQGKVSYAMSFYLSNPNATLKDKEIDAAMERIRAAIEKNHNAQIR